MHISSENARSLVFPCQTGEHLELEFIHSMYHVPQRETYMIQNDSLLLQSVFFGDARVALYYDAYGVYTMIAHEDGSYEISGINALYPEIHFAVAHGTDYTISVGERIIDINKYFPHSSRILIQRARTNLLSVLLYLPRK